MANLLTRFKKCGIWAGNGFWVGTQGAETQVIASSGNIALNTNKFTVAYSSGNTSVGGTLGVTGAATLSSTLQGPGDGYGTYTIRARVPIATVNTGYTIVAAAAGLKYRVVDVYMIAVGGAVTSTNVTHLEVRGTQSAGSAVLYKVAKAQLTQSTVNRVGTASTIVLADGASFVANDVNTAITLNPLGGTDAAGATNIDIVLTYAVEA